MVAGPPCRRRRRAGHGRHGRPASMPGGGGGGGRPRRRSRHHARRAVASDAAHDRRRVVADDAAAPGTGGRHRAGSGARRQTAGTQRPRRHAARSQSTLLDAPQHHRAPIYRISHGNLTIQYDTRCYFNVRSKADMSQLNLLHRNNNNNNNYIRLTALCPGLPR